MNKMCITVAEAAEVSVPIRGLLNLTNECYKYVMDNDLYDSFRPHQGIIEFN